MSTYLNCYTLVSRIRQIIEYGTIQKTKGIDRSGYYTNDQILDGINSAQRYLHAILHARIPGFFLKTASLVGVASVYTLPWDFGQLIWFKDADGNQISQIYPKDAKRTNATGSKLMYTRTGNTLVIDQSGVTDTCTLHYYRKPRDIDFGMASAGAAQSITLATSAKGIADYYNDMVIENITQNVVDTISDYTAARVATITGTGVASDYYGIVSDLPEPFHFLLIPQAVMLITGNYPRSAEKPNKNGVTIFQETMRATLSAFAGVPRDTNANELFDDFMAKSGHQVGWMGE